MKRALIFLVLLLAFSAPAALAQTARFTRNPMTMLPARLMLRFGRPVGLGHRRCWQFETNHLPRKEPAALEY